MKRLQQKFHLPAKFELACFWSHTESRRGTPYIGWHFWFPNPLTSTRTVGYTHNPSAIFTDFLRFELFIPSLANLVSNSLCLVLSSGMNSSYCDLVISFSTTYLLSKVSICSLSLLSSLVNRFWSWSASWFLSINVLWIISAKGSIYLLSAMV